MLFKLSKVKIQQQKLDNKFNEQQIISYFVEKIHAF